MVEIVTSATFDRWLGKFKDRRAAARIFVRIDRLAAGNPGDVKPVGQDLSELRIETFTPFDAANYLNTVEDVAAYPEAIIDDADDDPR